MRPGDPQVRGADGPGTQRGGTRTVSLVRHFPPVATDEPDTMSGTNTAPSPLKTVLVGGDGVIIDGCAKAMGFAYAGVDFECAGQIDVRGSRGVPGVRPYFESVDLKLVLPTDEPAERVEKPKRNVEHRCPVINLMRNAGVRLIIDGTTEPVERRAAG
ncbi:MAG: OsmC family protein [Pseudomonadota bacterium]